MTLLDKALTKAYARKSIAAAASPTPTSTRRGWVAKLRTPVRRAKGATAAPGVAPAHPPVVPVSSPVDPPTPAPRRSVRAGATLGRAEQRDDHPATIPAVPQSPATAWGWPAICDRLLDSPTAGPGLRGLASLLRELLAERGMRSLAFTGQGRAAGRTSLLLCVAKLLAEDPSSRIAIVDLDVGRPSIARRLGVTPAVGLWELAGGASSTQAIIPLVRGRLSLVGLVESVPPSAISARHVAAIEAALRGLREEFDLVLIDAGPRESSLTPHPLPPPAIEACVCVSRHGESAGELSLCESYRQAGIDVLGILETFVPAPSADAVAA